LHGSKRGIFGTVHRRRKLLASLSELVGIVNEVFSPVVVGGGEEIFKKYVGYLERGNALNQPPLLEVRSNLLTFAVRLVRSLQ